MKFNWGTGITIFFIFFAVSMTMAVMATYKHPPQLVQPDYYSLDINYQERLERKQNTAAMMSAPLVRFDASTKMIQVKFPEGMTAQTGTAKCYRSSTTNDDFTTKMDNVSMFDIPAATLEAGRWHVELEWETSDGKKYFWEEALAI